MKWKVDDDRLPCTVLHTILYTRQENNTEIMVGECSFTIGEVYIYQPLTTWLNLRDSDEVRYKLLISFVVFISSDRHVGIWVK